MHDLRKPIGKEATNMEPYQPQTQDAQQGGIPWIPGATTLGLVFKDGIILASEKRVSYGYFIASKGGKKVFKITLRAAAKLMSNILFNRRMMPLITQTIIAGIDDEGPSLWVMRGIMRRLK